MIKIFVNQLKLFMNTPIGLASLIIFVSTIIISGVLLIANELDPTMWKRAEVIGIVREGDKFDLKEESDRYIITVFK